MISWGDYLGIRAERMCHGAFQMHSIKTAQPPSRKPYRQELRADLDRCPMFLYPRHGT